MNVANRARRTTLVVAMAGLLTTHCTGSGDPTPPTTGSAGDPRILWSVNVGCVLSPGRGPIVSSEGIIFTAGAEEPSETPRGYSQAKGLSQTMLYAFNDRGELLAKLAGRIVVGLPSPPALSVAPWGTAYAVGGGIYGLWPDGRGGYRESKRVMTGPPAIGPDGSLYVGGQHGIQVVSLESDVGDATLWKEWSSSPVLAPDGTLYFVSRDMLHAMAPSGEVRRLARTSSLPILFPPDHLYIRTSDVQVAKLALTGETQWVFSTSAPLTVPPALGVGGTLFLASRQGAVSAVSATGNLKWTIELGAPVIDTQLVPDPGGGVWICDRKGRINKLGPDGDLQWRFDGSCHAVTAVPSLDGNVVYFGCRDNKLYAARVS